MEEEQNIAYADAQGGFFGLKKDFEAVIQHLRVIALASDDTFKTIITKFADKLEKSSDDERVKLLTVTLIMAIKYPGAYKKVYDPAKQRQSRRLEIA